MTFVLLEVGCLECYEHTIVLGAYKDGGAALAAYEKHAESYPPGKGEPEFLKGTATRVAPFGRLQLHEIGET